jgi:Lar family restriction alleviation protein
MRRKDEAEMTPSDTPDAPAPRGEPSTLAPCPFCGCADVQETRDPTVEEYTVTCWKCPVDGPERDTREDANAAWNNRAALASAGDSVPGGEPQGETVWAAFHRAWTACVGTPHYDKRVWIAAEAQLVRLPPEARHSRPPLPLPSPAPAATQTWVRGGESPRDGQFYHVLVRLGEKSEARDIAYAERDGSFSVFGVHGGRRPVVAYWPLPITPPPPPEPKETPHDA